MPWNSLFESSSLLVMPFWFLMIFLPFWGWSQRIIGSPLIILPAALLYVALVVPQIGEVFSTVSSPNLAAIAALLGSEAGATIGWVHFLAFDLFVGRWIFLDSRSRGYSAWLISPILFATLMLGPLGFAAYLGLRGLWNRQPLLKPASRAGAL